MVLKGSVVHLASLTWNMMYIPQQIALQQIHCDFLVYLGWNLQEQSLFLKHLPQVCQSLTPGFYYFLLTEELALQI